MELFLPLDLVDLLKCCLEVEQAKLLVEMFEWIYYKFDFLLLSPLSDTQQIIKIIFKCQILRDFFLLIQIFHMTFSAYRKAYVLWTPRTF